MRFRTEKGELVKTIQRVQNAIASKSTLPILSNILLEAENSKMRITATDLDLGISSTMPIESEVNGAMTLPAKKFLDIIKELPENTPAVISSKKNNIVTVECGKVVFKVVGLPKSEFPQPPEFKNKKSITMPQKLLKSMISMTLFAVSRDETRYILNGILFVIRNGVVKLIATDGRRLAVVERSMPTDSPDETKVIIPTKAIQEIQRLLGDEGDVKVVFDENQAMVELKDTVVISRLIEGEFPNCEQVIPQEAQEKVRVDRDQFLAATRRASLFTNQDSMAIKLDISKNRMAVSKNTPYMGEVREELDINYKGRDISIGFNPYYIIEVLKNIDNPEIAFEIMDSDKPGVIRIGSEYVYVVLPMQIT
jgi:DNA polymerase-3 subunit beta